MGKETKALRGKKPEPERRIGILLSRKCNYQCRHCYISCHPQGESMDLESVKKIVNNFPENVTGIYLSGGEVFFQKKLLYDVLVYLSSCDFPLTNTDVVVGTNGFWGHNDAIAKRIVNELIDLNLKFPIHLLMSYDSFHKEQGSKLDNLKRIKRIVDGVPPERLTAQMGINKDKFVFPIGRAASSVPRRRWKKNSKCVKFVHLKPDYYHVVVDFKGDVHLCCLLTPPILGNAINNPMIKILEDAHSNKLFKLLEQKGISEVASSLGWSKKDIERKIKEGGECWLCDRVFSKI